MYLWLLRICVANTWPPKVPSDVWRPPPSALWGEQAEEGQGLGEEQEEELVLGQEEELRGP